MTTRCRSQASRRLDGFLDRLFYCPSCTTWRLPTTPALSRCSTRTSRRKASSLASTTAINATKPVPKRLRPLYDALNEARKRAPAHVNISRLQLALQGLESNNPTIRTAVLGIDAPQTARRLVRLLLADALEDEAIWESQIADGLKDFSRGLIIRYGHQSSSNNPRPQNSVPVLYIPSNILERYNVELLISSVNGLNGDTPLQTAITPADTFLSPVIGTPASFEGRHTIISQPVHRSLLVARGLNELLVASKLLATTRFSSLEDQNSIRVVVNLEGIDGSETGDGVYILDAQQAEDGLAAIRRSVTEATDYEHKWIRSGMPALSNWLAMTASSETSQTASLPQPVEDLISSVLESAASSVEAAKLASYQDAAEHNLGAAQRFALDAAIDEFSRSAHQELQSGLASAWSSRNWRKLAWYKLFWRVDDVGLIITDLVSNAWLPKTERAVYEISGRLIQIGVNPVMEAKESAASLTVEKQPETGSVVQPVLEPTAQLASEPIRIPQTEPIIATNASGKAAVEIRPTPLPVPISATISRSRTTFISNSIDSLTTTAQQLVLRTLAITGLTGGLTTLTYLSSLSGGMYEAGTIAAVGTVFALWRMQGGWQQATRQLEQGLFAQGREVIVEVVDRMRTLVERKAVVVEDQVEKEMLTRAEESVKNARDELDKLRLASSSPSSSSSSSPVNKTKAEITSAF